MNTLKMLISILTSAQLMFLQIVVPIATTASLFPSSVYAVEETTGNAGDNQLTPEEIREVHADEDYGQQGSHSEPEAESATAEEAHQENAEQNAGDAIAGAASQVGGQLTKIFKGIDPGSAADMLNFITIMVIGLVAASLFMCEKKSADIYLAAVGGVIYIGGEVMQLFKSKAEYDDKEIEYNTTATGQPDLTDVQSEAFKKQSEAYTEAKSAAENKAKMQKAAGVAWLTAAVVAMAFQTAIWTTKTSCSAEAITYSAASLGTMATVCADVPGFIIKDEGESKIPQMSATDFSFCSVNSAAIMKCPAVSCGFLSTTIFNSCASCGGANVTNNTLPLENQIDHLQKKYAEYKSAPMCHQPEESLGDSNIFIDIVMDGFEKVSNLIFPKANADFKQLFGGLGVGVGIVLIFKKSIQGILDTLWGRPWKRAIAYGLMSTLAFTTSKKNEDVAKDMEENINKIRAIQNRFNNLQRSRGIINGAFNRGGNLTAIPLRAGTQISPAEKPMPCLHQNKNKKCVSAEGLIENSLGQSNLDLPGGVVGIARTAGATADGISGRSNITGAAVDGVNTLSANATKLDRLKRKLQQRLNNQLKKDGKKPFNFAQAEKNLLGKLQGSMLKSMDRKGISGQDAFAAAFPSTNPSSLGKPVKEELKNAVANVKQPKVNVAQPNFRGNSGGGFNFDMDADELKAEPLAEEKIGLDGLAEGDLEVDDIVQDANVSIFKVISVRYLKSGYPRVLKTIEPKESNK